MIGRTAGTGGWGKFDHDLKARAAQGTGIGRRRPSRPSRSRDSMTLPDDSTGEATVLPSPAPEPVDTTPEVLQREPLHFIVVILLLADIIFGLGLAVFAEEVLNFRPMAIL